MSTWPTHNVSVFVVSKVNVGRDVLESSIVVNN